MNCRANRLFYDQEIGPLWSTASMVDPAPMGKTGLIGHGVMDEKVALYIENHYPGNLI